MPKNTKVLEILLLDVVLFYCCVFVTKKVQPAMPRQFHEKKSLKIALKLFFNMFLMNFQRLEFSDDIQPMFVSVMADEVSY